MSDHSAAILELAALGGDTPTIRTADGRTLREGCHMGGKIAWDKSAVEIVTQCSSLGTECVCQGRGWLPVSEAEAVVVCLKWLPTRYRYMTLYAPGILTNCWTVQVNTHLMRHPSSYNGETLDAAVFAALEAVSDENTN